MGRWTIALALLSGSTAACNAILGNQNGSYLGAADGAADVTAPEPDAAVDAAIDGSKSGAEGGSSVPVAPPAAAAAGFTTLVFEDDFTTTDTIATTQSAASGYKWYWSFDITAPVWSVNTTATAATLANGNAGGGPNASPKGGILTLTGPGFPNSALITVPGGALNNSGAVLPAEGSGCWSHAYFEAYLQFKIDGNTLPDQSTGWPAFYSWSVQALGNFGFASSSLMAASYTGIDFMESYGSPGNWAAELHQWPANATSDGVTQHTDDNWHTYGCLWTATGTGTGQVRFYFDGVQVDQTVITGINQMQFSLESMDLFLALGTGVSWDLNVDWVRVWQS
jgi:hypothetical protein